MGLKDLFKPNPLKHEKRGDDWVRVSDWGRAKLAYEEAMDALERVAPLDAEAKTRLSRKLQGSKESLSQDHVQASQDLFEAGYDDEARELLELAQTLTQDPDLQMGIQRALMRMEQRASTPHRGDEQADLLPFSLFDEEREDEVGEDETFMALLSGMPEEARTAYSSYGPHFQSGYLALNRGDFQIAADALSRAMEENDPSPSSYIPLELATALLNLQRLDEARALLEAFVKHHPEALPGYQILCELLWETGAFDQAEALLKSCPEELQHSRAYVLLRGENLSQAGRPLDAIVLYQAHMKTYGRQDTVLKALAGSYEATGDLEKARDIYHEMAEQCRSCHARVDPLVKRRLADVRFAMGERDVTLLEAYLSLAREDPSYRPFYFEQIRQIYSSMGNEPEARRFHTFAEQAKKEQGGHFLGASLEQGERTKSAL